MKLQVLVATIEQSDLSLIEKMNIRCNAIIANQTDHNNFVEKEFDFGKVLMISTNTRGVGLNRNIAMLAAKADVLLFADDDMVYYDGSLDGVVEAFNANKSADVIIFGVDIIKNGEIVSKRHYECKRAHIWNSMKYGTYAVAIRRSALIKANIKFNELFGGGCKYSAGEDSLFIKSCFERKLKVYTDSYVLGTCCKDSSTWFEGYNEKYFYDKGVLLRFLFPKLKYIMAIYFGIRFKRKTQISVAKRLKLIYKGIMESKYI